MNNKNQFEHQIEFWKRAEEHAKTMAKDARKNWKRAEHEMKKWEEKYSRAV